MIESNGSHGIWLEGDSGAITISGDTIRNNGAHGIWLTNDGSAVAITGNTITGNAGWGVCFEISSQPPAISGNTITGNTSGPVGIGGGTLTANATWPVGGSPYVVTSTIGVAAGVTLTIEPGVVVKFVNGGGLQVSGQLNATGTSGSKIYFTDQRDDSVGGDTNGDGTATSAGAGWWCGIWVEDGGTATMAYTSVRYAGNGGYGWNANIYKTGSGSISLTNSTISNSSQYGLLIRGSGANHSISGNVIESNGSHGIWLEGDSGAITISGDTIRNNGAHGIWLTNDGSAVAITGNTITGNSSYGLYNPGTTHIDATNNNWGSPTGPKDDSDDRDTGGLYNPGGLGDRVSDNVNYYPWTGMTNIGSTAVPTGLDGTPGNGVVDLTWTANTEPYLGGYKIYYGIVSGAYGNPIMTGTNPFYQIPGLSNGSHYYIAISSLNPVGFESAKSTEIVVDLGCTFYTIDPPVANAGSAGGSGEVAVTAGSHCDWSVSSGESWITLVSGPNGSGRGSVAYTVLPNNSTTPRSGTMTIAGQTFTVNQSPMRTLAVTKVGSGAGAVTTDAGALSWSGATGSGNFHSDLEVTLTAAPNDGSIFDGWEGDADCRDGRPTMDANKSCGARFTLNQCLPAPTGLLSWWTAQEVGEDLMGDYPGTMMNGASYAAGRVGQAFTLDGVDDYMDTGDADLPSAFTLDAWILPERLDRTQYLLSKDDGDTLRSYALSLDEGGYFSGFVRSGDGLLTRYRTVSPAVGIATWSHVALVYDGNAASGQKMRFFVNGELVPAGVVSGADNGGSPENNPVTLKIGIAGDGSTGPFQGRIDEVEIVVRALSLAEAGAIYNAGSVGNCTSVVTLDQIGNKTVAEGNLLAFTVSGRDPGGHGVSYAANPLPAGASLSESSGSFSWTPGYDQAGSYAVTFSVTDGTHTDFETITITVSNTNRAPTLGTVTPAVLTSATGMAQTFRAIYSDADGHMNLKYAYLLINTTVNGVNSIYLLYDRTVDKLYLYNDAKTGYVGNCTPGVAGSLTNTQGTLNCAATTVSGSGNDLTINWNITPSAAFASATTRNLYLYALDMSNAIAMWTDKGDWTIKATNVAPTLGSVTPAAITTAPAAVRTFSAVYSDADGYANVKSASLLINTTADGVNGISLLHDRTVNKLYLYNDAGTEYAGNCTPGVAGSLTNTQGTLNCAATTLTGSGNNLTINWNITPSAAFASATTRNLYLAASDLSNETVSWTDKGDWTIKATNVAPTLGSVTPAALTSAPGVARTFSAVYSDADGYANVKYAYLLINTTVDGVNSIYLLHDRTVNKLYLYNDAKTGYVGNCTPGVAGSLSNTQGTLNCAATTVSGSGNDLTINWNITPSAAFASATTRNLYLYALDMSNAIAMWTDKGDWTIKTTNVAPTLGAVTPAELTSQPATAQTFSAVYSDADGYANVKLALLSHKSVT